MRAPSTALAGPALSQPLIADMCTATGGRCLTVTGLRSALSAADAVASVAGQRFVVASFSVPAEDQKERREVRLRDVDVTR